MSLTYWSFLNWDGRGKFLAFDFINVNSPVWTETPKMSTAFLHVMPIIYLNIEIKVISGPFSCSLWLWLSFKSFLPSQVISYTSEFHQSMTEAVTHHLWAWFMVYVVANKRVRVYLISGRFMKWRRYKEREYYLSSILDTTWIRELL